MTISIKDEINLRRLQFQDSGYLVATNSSAITSGSNLVIAINEKWKPYDDVIVVNGNTDNDATATINYSNTQPLLKGTQTRIGLPMNAIMITNNGTTSINANDIKIYYRYTGYKGKDTINYISKVSGVGLFIKNILT